ncbi:hypothetical protein ACCS93_18245, partial [Rhizobium ruizarguesonis]
YSAMKSARALGFATSRHLHHVPGHDLLDCYAHRQLPQGEKDQRADALGVGTQKRLNSAVSPLRPLGSPDTEEEVDSNDETVMEPAIEIKPVLELPPPA